jgi:hypothetical protein
LYPLKRKAGVVHNPAGIQLLSDYVRLITTPNPYLTGGTGIFVFTAAKNPIPEKTKLKKQ